ncbi:MAG: DEAD/DEAH box helicase [Crenarchaeota archaeon]|nr:DEAD/DEAH box helicase [Thermoproteota archaeon]
MAGVSGSFRLLHPRLQAALELRGYRQPTPVQEKAIPAILRGENVLIIAPTGSGKTEAALLPIFSRLIGSREPGVKAIYVTPLRSLNRDIFRRLAELAASVGLRLEVRHGDSTSGEKRRFLMNPPDIMVTTPETLYFLLSVDRFRESLKSLRFIVVDEVHELVSSKRGVEFSLALERLERWYARRRLQVAALSATVADPWRVGRLVFSWRRFVVVEPAASKKLAVTVDYAGPGGAALRIAEYVGSVEGPVLVFANTRDTAEMLAVELAEILGEDKVRVHHGSLSREVRVEVERLLKQGRVKVVVATSSLELGIDVGSVGLVVQYLSPRQALKLTQRAGRSGHRLDAESRAVIVSDGSVFDLLESAVIAARAARGDIEELPAHSRALDALVHQLVGMAIEKGRFSVWDAYGIVAASAYYEGVDIDYIAEAVDVAAGSRLLRRSGETLSPGARSKSYYFSTTMIPDTVQYMVVDVESGRRIGSLDEEFVVTLEPGSVFVLSGRLWEVVDIEGENVRVRPKREVRLVLPSWEGDLIPVDYKVAREVASLLRRFEARGRLPEGYPLVDRARRRVEEVLRRHLETAKVLPHDRRLVVEAYGDTVVVYCFLGSRGCKAMEYLLSAYLEQAYGIVPQAGSTPYVVLLRLPRPLAVEEVVRALRSLADLPREERRRMLASAVKRSRVYEWILYRVAQRAGALPRRGSDAAAVKAILRTLKDTPIGEEAMREIMTVKVDCKPLERLFEGIKRGSIEVVGYQGRHLTPLTQEAAGEARLGERVSPEKLPPSLIAEIVKRRMAQRDAILVCMRCGETTVVKISRLPSYPEKPRCPRCGASLLAPVYSEEEAHEAKRLLAAARRGKLRGADRKRLQELMERADLVLQYGRYAVEALYSRGVGVVNARRALKNLTVFGEAAFYEALVKAEANYARYRGRLQKSTARA